MKIVIPLFFVFAMMLSGVSIAQTESSPYVSQLNSLTAKCDMVAIGAATDDINARAASMPLGGGTNGPFIQKTKAGTDKINSCLSDTKKKGVELFRQYSKNKSPTIKQDMKAILIAWLPYVRASATHVRSTHLGEMGSNSIDIVKAAYDKAVSTLQVDRLTN